MAEIVPIAWAHRSGFPLQVTTAAIRIEGVGAGMVWQRYVALGDSFTEGVGDPGPGDRYRGWADRLAQGLASDNPDFLYANLAIRGRKLGQIVQEQVPAAVELSPDLVTFAGGVNDALRRDWDFDYLADNLDQGVSALRGTGADVVLLTFGRPSARSRLMARVESRLSDYRDLMLDVADRYDCMVVDFWEYDALADPRFWADDRLHLNEVGHQRVSQAALEVLGYPQGPWWAPLPPVKEPSLMARAGDNVSWAGKHFAPWIGRRLTGRSSGDGLVPKRPELQPVESVSAN